MATTTNQLLRHVVLFKFKESSSPADIAQLEREFHALATVKVREVKEFEWGTNVSKEKLDHGYTHCFLLTFASEKDRDVYIDHDDHKGFVKTLMPHLDSATVIDYWASSK